MSDEGYIRAYAHDCNGGLHGDDTSVPCDYVGGHQSDRQSATDDPREILKAAGVECADVEAWAEKVFTGEFSELKTEPEAMSIIGPLREVVVTSDAAIVALARIVAKYKWFAEHEAVSDDCGQTWTSRRRLYLESVQRLWAEHGA